jgi:hypothetical protein
MITEEAHKPTDNDNPSKPKSVRIILTNLKTQMKYIKDESSRMFENESFLFLVYKILS